jgi:hypothetical protein
MGKNQDPGSRMKHPGSATLPKIVQVFYNFSNNTKISRANPSLEVVGGIREEATEDEICLVQLDLQPVDLVCAAVQLFQLLLHPRVQLLPTGSSNHSELRTGNLVSGDGFLNGIF